MYFKGTAVLLIGGLLLNAPSLMAQKTAEMKAVIISAKAPVDSAQFAGSVSVISAEDIRTSGATTVTEVLESTPGIQLVVTGSSSSKAPQLRGQDTDQVLVLINGKRLPNTDRNLPFAPGLRYNWVPIANIERIEVIRGPASSLYGADALAGVINIITRKATQQWRGNLSLHGKQTDDANGGDGQGISVATSGSISDSVDLALALESTRTDAIFDEDDRLTIQSEREVNNFQADLGIDINDNNRLQLGILAGNEEGKDIDNGFRGIGEIPLDIDRRRLALDYQATVGKFSTNAGIMVSNADVEEGGSRWDISENGAAIDAQGQVGANHYLSFGVNYRQEEAERSDSIIFEDEVDATTLFFQDLINIGSSNTLTLGLAYDNHSKYDNELSPKINWFSQLSPTISIKAGYGESYLAPSLREGSSAYVVPAGPTRTYIGNDDLQPETNKTYEVGMTYEKNNVMGFVTLFRTETDDLIALVDTADTTGPLGAQIARYSNVDKALTEGVETGFTINTPANNTRFNMSYTYLKSEDQSRDNQGKELTFRAKHSAKLNLVHTLPSSGVQVDAGIRYVGDQYTDTANTNKIEAYSVADLGVSKELSNNFQLRFGVDNVGNKQVINDNQFELLEEGRSYKLTLNSTF